MDEIDLKILKILKENSRTKYVSIANHIGLTEGAVRHRVKKLSKEGVIKSFTVDTTVEFEGIVLVETKYMRTGIITKKMNKFATRVFEVSGDYDIAALIQAYTIVELNRKIDEIRRLPGVQSTKTLIKLKD